MANFPVRSTVSHAIEVTERSSNEGGAGDDPNRSQPRQQTASNLKALRCYREQDMTIGVLQGVASLDNVYDRLVNKALIILVSNGVMTFLVSGFVVLIFYYLVTRCLALLSQFIRDLDLDRHVRSYRENLPQALPARSGDHFSYPAADAAKSLPSGGA